MWKKIIIDALSYFKDNIFKYIFPKYRARAETQEKLKEILNGFPDYLSSQKSFSLESMIRDLMNRAPAPP